MKRKLSTLVISALVATLAATAAPLDASAITWTRDDAVHTYKNAFGVTLMRHTAIVQWSGNKNGLLYSTPKALSNVTYQFTGVSRTASKTGWSWYQAKQGGTAQSKNNVSWLIGIPTPWGGVGTTHHSVILNQVNGYGGMGRIQ